MSDTHQSRSPSSVLARGGNVGKSHLDLGLGILLGLSSLCVYLLTLCPGLFGEGDTPEMQYVGRVLRGAHSPGYPLYVVLTHFASYLPVGSLAYRINLFSAICAACTVVLVFAACRECGCNRGSSATAAASLGFGRIFWSQAVVAEVYTLAAALLALALFGLLRWRRMRSRRWLYIGVAALGLSLAHHWTIVTVIPAAVLFVALTEWRLVRELRVWLISLCLVALGPAFYGYMLLHARGDAPGAGALAFTQLGGTLRCAQFSDYLFVFGPRQVIFERLPLVAGIVRAEIGGIAALGLVALGSGVLLIARRWADVLLLLCGATGPMFFAMNYDVPDVPVFLTLTFVLVAPVIGIGLTWASRRLPLAVACGMIVLPAWQLVRNYGENDRSRHVMETRLMAALFEKLPRPSAVADNEYTTDQMLRYKIAGEDAGQGMIQVIRGADDVFVRHYLNKGWPVFAIGTAQPALAALGYKMAPVSIPCVPLLEYLADRPGTVAIIAATGGPLASQHKAIATDLAGVLGINQPVEEATIFCGTIGARRGGRMGIGALKLRTGEALGGTTLPVPLTISTDRMRVGILIGDRIVAEASSGVLLVLLDADGSVAKQYALAEDLLVPAGNRAYGVSQVRPRS